jgi:CubicO group peptidase (beta-lactamase class C family)
MRPVRSLLSAVAVALAARQAHAQAAPPPWAASVDSLMRAEMARAGVPGAQIAVAQNGRVVYTRGYGVANVESGRPVTERTLFQLGSVTKTFTSALLAQLAAEGRLDLHAPISRYVTELAGRRVGAVTAHQLLTMTAGWADAVRPFGTTDEAAMGRVLSAVADTVFLTEPGRVYSYSNPGFSMAGYVAERAAGTPFVDLAERVVLRKLGMPRATFRPLVAMTHDFSVGHGRGDGGATVVLRPTPGNAIEYGGGFLYASAAEVARLGIALMAGGMLDGERVLAADAVRAMTTGDLPIPGYARNRIGYGLHVDTVAGRRVWRKNGNVTGFSSQLTMWPDRQLAVVISTNRNVDVPERADVLAAQLVTGLTLTEAPMPAGRPATDDERRQVVGRYRYGMGSGTVEVAEVNGELEWRGTRRSVPLRMVSATRMVGEPPGEPPIQASVVRDAAGRVLYLHIGARAYVKVP